jgi:hypothetical protein
MRIVMDLECRRFESFGDLFYLGQLPVLYIQNGEKEIPLHAWRLPLVFAKPLSIVAALRKTTTIFAASKLFPFQWLSPDLKLKLNLGI